MFTDLLFPIKEADSLSELQCLCVEISRQVQRLRERKDCQDTALVAIVGHISKGTQCS